jgi:hypothetical protein
MARTKISEYSATAADNTDINSINIAEGCAPSGINNAIREMMKQLKDFQAGTSGDSLTNSNVIFTGGSINGTTIGATTASTVASTNLSYTGTLTGGTGVVNIGSGQVYKDASGNVGIGTSSPNIGDATRAMTVSATNAENTSAVELQGNRSANGNTVSFLGFYNSTNNIARVTSLRGVNANDGTLTFSTAASGSLAERLRITSAGNVGIGTSSPFAKLHVVSGANFFTVAGDTFTSANFGPRPQNDGICSVLFTYSGSSINKIDSSAGGLGFFTGVGPAERARIDSSGNVGIGTSSPARKLHVVSGDTTAIARFAGASYAVRVTSIASVGGVVEATSTTESTYQPLLLGGSVLQFTLNGAEKARIDSSGNVYVGTTALPSTSNPGIRIGNPATNFWYSFNAGTAGYTQFVFGNANGAVGSISTSGSSTTFSTSSDYRLKENVAPMQNALATVAQLNPVTYTWKADGSAGQGFIAHELQAVVPDAVTGEKDAVRTVDVHDDEGRVIGTKEEPQYQGVDTSFLVATLTKAIQELKAEVDSLKAQLNSGA